MDTKAKKQGLVWGGLLIVFGVISLVDQYITITEWVWVGILAAAGLGVLAVFLTDRSEIAFLILTYVLWAVAGLIALVTFNVLQGEFIATFVLTVIAVPFLIVFQRYKVWWSLIPAYILITIGVMVGLIGLNVLDGEFIATFVLTVIGLPFLVVYLRDREQWWYLVPFYALTAVGVMVGLIGMDILDGLTIPAYVFLTVAIPFLAAYVRNPKLWWALIPGGMMGCMGIAFLSFSSLLDYVIPAVFILAGLWVIVRQFRGGEVE